MLDTKPGPLKLAWSYFEKGKSHKAGAPGSDVFELHAHLPGVAILSFVYRRPWADNLPPAKTFWIRVTTRQVADQ